MSIEKFKSVSPIVLTSHGFFYDYMDNFLNRLFCGFREPHSTRYALIRLIQSCQKELDQSGFVGTIMMDLFKAYDCLPHDLMIAKLEAYNLAKESLQLISDYLSYLKQGSNIGSAYSDWWVNVICGIPQGSIESFTFQYFYL